MTWWKAWMGAHPGSPPYLHRPPVPAVWINAVQDQRARTAHGMPTRRGATMSMSMSTADWVATVKGSLGLGHGGSAAVGLAGRQTKGCGEEATCRSV